MTKSSRSSLLFLSGAVAWCALIVFPVFKSVEFPLVSSLAVTVDRAFSTICHQYDSRSFHLFGERFGVCSRCTAIYAGFACGVLLWRLNLLRSSSKSLFLWSAALLPMVLDVVLDASAIHPSGFFTRVSSGGWFGIVAGFIITPTFIQGCNDLETMFNNAGKRAYESTVG